ncbi:MAG: hybrid sensor histidine kinase/response regulator [Aphanothece sp. CMT-3BRIN-NPC111]|nr:hybrid sensor histidine kinase/response regulator [Aphanothece sp. CMT-3BRIN-NPC111]
MVSGQKAIETAANTQPDLVLMDIMMPGEIDGVEAAEQIRSNFQIPIVFLTAYADDKTIARATLTEPFGYLVKPFEDKELHSNIEIALKRHQAEAKIRARLETAENLRKQAQEERDKKSSYISMASHEFRNPLTSIISSAELLSTYDEKLSAESKSKFLGRIESAARKINDLLEDVLTLGRAESSKITFTPAPLDIVKFCHELVEVLQETAGSNHTITLISESEADCRKNVLMDENLLDHILANLVSNAIKYSPQGGDIYLELKCESNCVTFSVKDSGIGIPPEDQAQMFEAFHRASNVGSLPGTGLGLAIVKKSVELHGGQIAVASQVGVGTTFTVTIPLN